MSVVLGWRRVPGDGLAVYSLVQAWDPHHVTVPISFAIWNPLRYSRGLAQLAIDTCDSHVGQDVARFTSIRDWRAVVLAALSWPGIGLPVPKYISSGV